MSCTSGSPFTSIPQYDQKLNFLVTEEFCVIEKEENLNAFLRSNSEVRVSRTCTWKIVENYCFSDMSVSLITLMAGICVDSFNGMSVSVITLMAGICIARRMTYNAPNRNSVHEMTTHLLRNQHKIYYVSQS